VCVRGWKWRRAGCTTRGCGSHVAHQPLIHPTLHYNTHMRTHTHTKVIVMARKPDFFSYNMSLYEVVTQDGLMRPVLAAKRGGLYCGGRWVVGGVGSWLVGCRCSVRAQIVIRRVLLIAAHTPQHIPLHHTPAAHARASVRAWWRRRWVLRATTFCMWEVGGARDARWGVGVAPLWRIAAAAAAGCTSHLPHFTLPASMQQITSTRMQL